MRVLPFADHEIGYNSVRYLLELEDRGIVEVPFLITTSSNNEGWWLPLTDLNSNKQILIFDDSRDINDFLLKDIDLVFLISWKYLMPEAFVSHYKYILNLHYSLLPKFRGVYPVNWAIIEGEPTTGVTFHSINEQIDKGQILTQREITIQESDTAYSLLKKLDVIAYNLFKEVINKYLISEDFQFEDKLSYDSDYYSRRRFNHKSRLELDSQMKVGEVLNLLKGYTFKDGSSLAHFIGRDGKKYWVSIDIKINNEHSIQ